jgi:hypothetical protein
VSVQVQFSNVKVGEPIPPARIILATVTRASSQRSFPYVVMRFMRAALRWTGDRPAAAHLRSLCGHLSRSAARRSRGTARRQGRQQRDRENGSHGRQSSCH